MEFNLSGRAFPAGASSADWLHIGTEPAIEIDGRRHSADERRRVLDQLRQRLLERNYLNNLIATIEREIAALGAARG